MNTKDSIFISIGAVAFIASASVVGVKLLSPSSDASTKVASTSTIQPATSSTSTNNSSTTASASKSTSATNSSSSTNSTSSSNSGYKDGTYSASASYQVPSGTNTITTTIAIKNGNITSANTNSSYSDGESGMYINSFESNLSSDATGQSLSSYSPSRIGGASLTTGAFSYTLDQIKSDASA